MLKPRHAQTRLSDEEFQNLLGQYELAQATLKKFKNLETSWETARSLLARQRITPTEISRGMKFEADIYEVAKRL